MWYILSHHKLPVTRILKRARSDGKPPEQPCYIEYIITDKEDDKINWNTTDRTTPVEELL